VHPYMTPFGQSDEMLCYFDGTLIGSVVVRPNADALVVDLLPKLDKYRSYPWPTIEQFERALLGLLRECEGWSLQAERDTDQVSVPLLCNRASLSAELATLLRYCVGATLDCPTFRADGGKLVA